MRIMGLDVGEKRIGIALSDPLGLVAQPWEVWHRTNLEADLAHLTALIREYGIEAVVVGLPRNMNGTLGPQAEKVSSFVRRLAEVIAVPVYFWDERLTTSLAEQTLLAGDVRRKRRRQVVDKMAAAVILQGYLDRQGLSHKTDPENNEDGS